MLFPLPAIEKLQKKKFRTTSEKKGSRDEKVIEIKKLEKEKKEIKSLYFNTLTMSFRLKFREIFWLILYIFHFLISFS